MACSKARNGKHVWTVNVKEDYLGFQVQYRRCDYCHLRQKYVRDIFGRGSWKNV
jgi:hypothetical protein